MFCPLQSSDIAGSIALEVRGLPSHQAEVPRRDFDIFPRCGDLCRLCIPVGVGRSVCFASVGSLIDSPEKVGNARRSNLGAL